MKPEIELDTPDGRGILGYDNAPILYVTNLGIVMLKVWITEKERWINYRLSDIHNILPSDFTIINNNEYEQQTNKSESYITLE